MNYFTLLQFTFYHHFQSPNITFLDNVSKSKIRKESNELKGSPKKQSSDGITIKNKKNNSPDAKEKAKKNLTRNLYKRRSQVPLAETKPQEIKSINRLKSGFQPTNLTINSQRCSNTDTKDQEVINKQDNFLNLNNNEVEDMEWEVSCDDVAVHVSSLLSFLFLPFFRDILSVCSFYFSTNH